LLKVSGHRELNPIYTHPKRVYYRYTMPRYLSEAMAFKKAPANEISKENSKADKKLLTLTPFTIDDANQRIKALITKVKIPKVRRFMGKVRIIASGRNTALKTPNTAANQKADQNPDT
jgi:hypothetical protein